MEKRELKKRINAIASIAQGQTLGGKLLIPGEGMVASKIDKEPFRILDGCPVYHSENNTYDLPILSFQRNKTYKWGEFYHPELMIGSPPIGGWNRLYIDTRIKGWYILWIASKLNEDDIGPSDWSYDIVSWTPKQDGDSITKAGYRLFWAASLAMDYVDKDSFNSTDYENEDIWTRAWDCSPSCFIVFASLRGTSYKDEDSFQRILSDAPEVFRPHLILRRLL